MVRALSPAIPLAPTSPQIGAPGRRLPPHHANSVAPAPGQAAGPWRRGTAAPEPCQTDELHLGSAGILRASRAFDAPELTLSPPPLRQSLPLAPSAASLEKAPRRDHGQQYSYAQCDTSGPDRTQELQHHDSYGVAGHRCG